MLSFASAAFDADGTMLGTHTANLATLPDAITDPDTWLVGAEPRGVAGVPIGSARSGHSDE